VDGATTPLAAPDAVSSVPDAASSAPGKWVGARGRRKGATDSCVERNSVKVNEALASKTADSSLRVKHRMRANEAESMSCQGALAAWGSQGNGQEAGVRRAKDT
jgi:hypothetical protein